MRPASRKGNSRNRIKYFLGPLRSPFTARKISGPVAVVITNETSQTCTVTGITEDGEYGFVVVHGDDQGVAASARMTLTKN